MELAKKNQGEDFKKHTRFLKIFPQYFAINVQSFYEDPEIETIKRLLLDLDIKLNIFDHKKILMDWIQLSRVVTVAFTVIATTLNWNELDNIQRVLFPLWILGICLPNLD